MRDRQGEKKFSIATIVFAPIMTIALAGLAHAFTPTQIALSEAVKLADAGKFDEAYALIAPILEGAEYSDLKTFLFNNEGVVASGLATLTEEKMVRQICDMGLTHSEVATTEFLDRIRAFSHRVLKEKVDRIEFFYSQEKELPIVVECEKNRSDSMAKIEAEKQASIRRKQEQARRELPQKLKEHSLEHVCVQYGQSVRKQLPIEVIDNYGDADLHALFESEIRRRNQKINKKMVIDQKVNLGASLCPSMQFGAHQEILIVQSAVGGAFTVNIWRLF